MSEENNTAGYLDMDLLRFTTAGSVDDGKSTLIGRLLYDSKAIFEDQLEAVEKSSKSRGDENVNLALLTDGLRSEREQGITIDVAYRYFATPKRKFIIADTPGHIQYTRNMVTGASTANLAILLVDARKGVIEQTCRHAFIANLLRIQHLVVCVNKMDLVDWSEESYNKIIDDFKKFASRLDNIVEVTFIPASALLGDNIVDPSENMPWYRGLRSSTIWKPSTSGRMKITLMPVFLCSGSSVRIRISGMTFVVLPGALPVGFSSRETPSRCCLPDSNRRSNPFRRWTANWRKPSLPCL